MDEFIHFVEENFPEALESFLTCQSNNTVLVNKMAASSISSPKLLNTESNASGSSVTPSKEQASKSRKTRSPTKKPYNNREDVNTSYINAFITTETPTVYTAREDIQEHKLTHPPPIFVIGENNMFHIVVYLKINHIDFSPVVKLPDGICVQMPDHYHHSRFKSYLQEKGLSHSPCIFDGELPEDIKELRRRRNVARRDYKMYPCEKYRLACRTLERDVKQATDSYKTEQWESYLECHPQDDLIEGLFGSMSNIPHMRRLLESCLDLFVTVQELHDTFKSSSGEQSQKKDDSEQ